MRLGGSTTATTTRRPSRGGVAAASLALALAALAGCGEDDGNGASSTAAESGSPAASASATPSPSASADPGAPGCDEVWVRGATIPRGYAGCNDDGGFVPRDALSCSSGQYLVRHGDRWFGVLGGKVRVAKSTLDDDDGYRSSVAKCRG